MKKKKDYDSIVKKLKELFDAVPEQYNPDQEELRLLEERNELEKETALSFEMYVENCDKLKEHGLDKKLMNQLEWFILFYLENRREEFLESEFYERFRDHEVVQRAEMEYERRISLKNYEK